MKASRRGRSGRRGKEERILPASLIRLDLRIIIRVHSRFILICVNLRPSAVGLAIRGLHFL
jgi:hypothetical protein